jgi:hypothetical protein
MKMKKNNLGRMYQYGLQLGLIQINKANKRSITHVKKVSFSIGSYELGFWQWVVF